MAELERTIEALKCKRAAGVDDVPAELWKILKNNHTCLHILLKLLNACWQQNTIPQEWKHASIIAVFKKGQVDLPENYRPISLLTIGYKCLAIIILNRLKRGGVNERIRETQFGFRPGRGTREALFLIRRIIDMVLSDKN
eukprot:12422961-Karenia_brevis.AAC.1